MFLIKRALVLLICFVCFQTAMGGSWTKQSSGTLAWLHSVYFANQNKGWIAGSSGTLLTTDDGGKTWKKLPSFTEDNIRDVYFSDEKNGWLLCERDIYGGEGFSPSYFLKTSDGGASWEKARIVSEGRERFARLFFSKNGNGFAVGESGSYLALQDDKKSWKKFTLQVRFLMLDGAFTDDLHGSLVGGGGTILFTEDGGMTWNPATVGGTERIKLSSVFFINQKHGWAAGGEGKIYATMNGGKFWREQNSTVKKNLADVFFIDTAEGFAAGDDGTILHTTTAGNVWSQEQTNVTHKLERIFFTGRKGFAVGFGGTILSYDAAAGTSDKRRAQPQLQKRN